LRATETYKEADYDLDPGKLSGVYVNCAMVVTGGNEEDRTLLQSGEVLNAFDIEEYTLFRVREVKALTGLRLK